MAKNASIIKARYDKVHMKPYYFKFHLENDADVISKLDSVESKQGYIKQLVREDIARTCSVPKQTGSVPDYEIIPVSVPKKFISDLQDEAKREGVSVSELIWLVALEDMPWLHRQSDSVPKNSDSVPNSPVPVSFRDPYAYKLADAIGTWIDKATSVLTDEKPYIISESAPKTE